MLDTVTGIFDACADHYATDRERKPYFMAQLQIATSMFAGELRGLVLDIGCAAGAEVSILRSLGFEVIGVDLSEKMLAFALNRFRGDPRVTFLRANAACLPISSASVDHILCLGVFELSVRLLTDPFKKFGGYSAQVEWLLSLSPAKLVSIMSALSSPARLCRQFGVSSNGREVPVLRMDINSSVTFAYRGECGRSWQNTDSQ